MVSRTPPSSTAFYEMVRSCDGLSFMRWVPHQRLLHYLGDFCRWRHKIQRQRLKSQAMRGFIAQCPMKR